MEFGVFLNGYLPGQAAHDPACEHEMLKREIGVRRSRPTSTTGSTPGSASTTRLTEYSHMSAPEVVMGYLAHATDRIHIGTGIMNLSPAGQPPGALRRAGDHARPRARGSVRVGDRPGRGQPRDRRLQHPRQELDQGRVERGHPPDSPHVGGEGLHVRGRALHRARTRTTSCPSPTRARAIRPSGSGAAIPGTFTQAGELGIGAIAFNFEPIYNLQGRIDAYKEGIANCTEPLGQFKNDNVMMTNAVICLNDRKKAREVALRRGRGYLYSLVCNYHDTIPHQEGVPVWPERPHTITDEGMLDHLIEGGWLLCGEPDEVAEQVAKYQTVGCDQLVFGLPSDSFMEDEVHEMLEVFGTKVIPQFDPDPIHSTTRYRQTAQRKYQDFNFPVPDITVEELPTNAMIQLDGTRTL